MCARGEGAARGRRESEKNWERGEGESGALEEAVALLMDKAGNSRGANFLRHKLAEQVKQCMVDVMRCATPKFLRKQGYFDLFGLDFMVTTSDQLLLLEVNTNPALSLDNSTLAEILPRMVDGALELVLNSQGPDLPQAAGAGPGAGTGPTAATDARMLAGLPGQWELLIDEAKGFEYGK